MHEYYVCIRIFATENYFLWVVVMRLGLLCCSRNFEPLFKFTKMNVIIIHMTMNFVVVMFCTIFIHVGSLSDSGMWLDAVTQNAWDTGGYICCTCTG